MEGGTRVPEYSSGSANREGAVVQRVADLMLSAPADVAADGDALTPVRVSELIGADRREVSRVWRSVLVAWQERAHSVGWAEEVRRALLRLEGVATLREASAAASHSHVVRHDAYGLTRAVVESSDETSLVWRRSGNQVLIATVAAEPARDGHVVIDHAAELRHVVSALLAGGEVVSTERLLHAVAISPELRSLGHLTPGRLTALAAAMSPHVLSNRRGDLYLVGLRPAYALTAISDSLSLGDASLEDVRRRVRGRFPGASPLPGDAELRELMRYTSSRTQVPDLAPTRETGDVSGR